jgi:homoserine O-acetyltransferase
MVALAFGERYPDRVARLIVISTADRAHAMASAWRVVQRRIVRFALESGQAAQGLALARALAMATYRSPEEFSARFAGAARKEDDRFVLPVEEYLFARGAEYAQRYRPESFVCLSESIDLHRVDAGRVFAPVTAVAVREDQLVPLADMRAMVARLPNAELHEISSVYGHDAFLKENRHLKPIFATVLNDVPGSTP